VDLIMTTARQPIIINNPTQNRVDYAAADPSRTVFATPADRATGARVCPADPCRGGIAKADGIADELRAA
jgi:hypothetical protein